MFTRRASNFSIGSFPMKIARSGRFTKQLCFMKDIVLDSGRIDLRLYRQPSSVSKSLIVLKSNEVRICKWTDPNLEGLQCDDLGFEASQSGHLLGVAFLLARFDPATRNFTVSLQKIKFLTEEFHRFGLFMRYSEALRMFILYSEWI